MFTPLLVIYLALLLGFLDDNGWTALATSLVIPAVITSLVCVRSHIGRATMIAIIVGQVTLAAGFLIWWLGTSSEAPF